MHQRLGIQLSAFGLGKKDRDQNDRLGGIQHNLLDDQSIMSGVSSGVFSYHLPIQYSSGGPVGGDVSDSDSSHRRSKQLQEPPASPSSSKGEVTTSTKSPRFGLRRRIAESLMGRHNKNQDSGKEQPEELGQIPLSSGDDDADVADYVSDSQQEDEGGVSSSDDCDPTQMDGQRRATSPRTRSKRSLGTKNRKKKKRAAPIQSPRRTENSNGTAGTNSESESEASNSPPGASARPALLTAPSNSSLSDSSTIIEVVEVASKNRLLEGSIPSAPLSPPPSRKMGRSASKPRRIASGEVSPKTHRSRPKRREAIGDKKVSKEEDCADSYGDDEREGSPRRSARSKIAKPSISRDSSTKSLSKRKSPKPQKTPQDNSKRRGRTMDNDTLQPDLGKSLVETDDVSLLVEKSLTKLSKVFGKKDKDKEKDDSEKTNVDSYLSRVRSRRGGLSDAQSVMIGGSKQATSDVQSVCVGARRGVSRSKSPYHRPRIFRSKSPHGRGLANLGLSEGPKTPKRSSSASVALPSRSPRLDAPSTPKRDSSVERVMKLLETSPKLDQDSPKKDTSPRPGSRPPLPRPPVKHDEDGDNHEVTSPDVESKGICRVDELRKEMNKDIPVTRKNIQRSKSPKVLRKAVDPSSDEEGPGSRTPKREKRRVAKHSSSSSTVSDVAKHLNRTPRSGGKKKRAVTRVHLGTLSVDGPELSIVSPDKKTTTSTKLRSAEDIADSGVKHGVGSPKKRAATRVHVSGGKSRRHHGDESAMISPPRRSRQRAGDDDQHTVSTSMTSTPALNTPSAKRRGLTPTRTPKESTPKSGQIKMRSPRTTVEDVARIDDRAGELDSHLEYDMDDDDEPVLVKPRSPRKSSSRPNPDSSESSVVVAQLEIPGIDISGHRNMSVHYDDVESVFER